MKKRHFNGWGFYIWTKLQNGGWGYIFDVKKFRWAWNKYKLKNRMKIEMDELKYKD